MSGETNEIKIRLAEEIAGKLFTNGFGEKAKRLVLELEGGSGGGGWCRDAVRDVIYDSLAAESDIPRPALEKRVAELEAADSFQSRVQPWLMECFGAMIAEDVIERNHRFLEEALELVQACGCSKDEAHQLVEYVFNRSTGEKSQEVGGVMVTLAALCLAQQLDMHEAGETELTRVWTKVEQIRAKQAAKPKYSPLPM